MSTEIKLYFRIVIFGLFIFVATYLYITWLAIPSPLNKSVADTAILLMGFSMILSSVCYFWNRFDKLIVYRKYLGLIGYAFFIAHFVLSFSAFTRLFSIENWEKGGLLAPTTGLIATIIFTVMALISNTFAAAKLGGKMWKFILRTGYIAVIFVTIHVIALRGTRWLTWFQEGMPTPPSMSLLVSIFMLIVLTMRVALWAALKKRRTGVPAATVTPVKQPFVQTNIAQASTQTTADSSATSPAEIKPPSLT